jgi:hypothetical protein
MQIGNLIPGMAATRQLPPETGQVLRVLAGDLSALQPGEQVRATVVQNTAAGTLLDLKGRLVTVELAPGLQPGAELSVKVAGQPSQPLLQVQPSGQPPPTLPALVVGQQVSARVLQQLPQGQVLLDLQGADVPARAPNDVKPGQVLSLQVAQLQPEVVLHILDSEGGLEAAAVKLLRGHASQPGSTVETLQQLQQALQTPAPTPAQARLQEAIRALLPQAGAPTAAQLAGQVRDGGLMYEAKLARLLDANPQTVQQTASGDLKGLLLRALQELETGPDAGRSHVSETSTKEPGPSADSTSLSRGLAHQADEQVPSQTRTGSAALDQAATVAGGAHPLKESVQAHLQQVERQQLVNVLAQRQGEAYQLQVPFSWGGELTTALVAIEPDATNRDAAGRKQRGYNFLFLLDLEGLGQTRIDAHFQGSGLRALFYAPEGEGLERIRGELPAFRATLEGLGYGPVLLDARPLREMNADKQLRFAALAAGAPGAVHLVDVRA